MEFGDFKVGDRVSFTVGLGRGVFYTYTGTIVCDSFVIEDRSYLGICSDVDIRSAAAHDCRGLTPPNKGWWICSDTWKHYELTLLAKNPESDPENRLRRDMELLWTELETELW